MGSSSITYDRDLAELNLFYNHLLLDEVHYAPLKVFTLNRGLISTVSQTYFLLIKYETNNCTYFSLYIKNLIIDPESLSVGIVPKMIAALSDRMVRLRRYQPDIAQSFFCESSLPGEAESILKTILPLCLTH